MKIFPIIILMGIYLVAPAAGKSGPIDSLKLAAEAYGNADYGRAVEIYRSLSERGYADADLYYNLGNAYFKQGQLAESILYYERAYQLEPSDPAIKHNLNVARARIRDRVEPIPLLFVVQWWNDLKSRHSSETLFLWSVALIWLLAAMVFIFFGFRNIYIRRAALGLGIAVAVLFVASVVLVHDKIEDLEAHRHGIIMPVEVSVSSAPDRSGVDAFIIHEGLKVEIIGQQDRQLHIRLPDGKEGWIAENYVTRI